MIGDIPVSILTVCQCAKGNAGHFEVAPIGIIELHGIREAAERIGWQLACQLVQAAIPTFATARVALVVDSGLQDLSRINERTMSVSGDWMLPEPFTLI